ncbi:MAG: E3 binding domain-containing protein [Candidatus Thorarchaeota archaeon]|jgi:pyruvate/2-oxoglutarate dehydrogenase complex dihydrolipoamide acyltransferase (E2) component
MAYRLKERCKHHRKIDGVMVRYNPGDILEDVPERFLNKFDKVDDPPKANPTVVSPGSADHNQPLIKVDMTESAKKFIDDNELDVTKIKGTGKDGKITKGDALAYYDSISGD